MKIMRFRGFSKYLTWVYWKTRWILLFTPIPMATIQETFIIDIPNDEWQRMVEANKDKDIDTSDYILISSDIDDR